MPESIVWRRPPRRRRFFLILLVLAIVVFCGRTVLSYYVDALWFGSLGYGEVFRRTLSFQWIVFLAFAAVSFVILYGTFLALKRVHLGDLPHSRTIIFGGRPVELPVEPVLRIVALCVSLLISVLTGANMMTEWPTLARYWYAPPPAADAVVDPILGRPLHFYLFTLPALQLVADWLTTLSVIVLAVTIFFFLITGGTRALGVRRESYYIPSPWRGISVAFAFLLLIPRDADVCQPVRAVAGRSHRLFRRDLHGRARDAHRHARRLRGAPSWRGDRRCQRRVGVTRATACRGDRSGRDLLSRPSYIRMVRRHLHRQTERVGQGTTLHRL